ncbi:MAG: DUF5752 family protein [bacterium]|nr:DUF5752 family protein [bacterium]
MAFQIRDCSLIARMAGVRSAMNLRELEERIAVCPDESLFHHFCETVIRPTFDNPDYNNDFAMWTSRYLQDRKLAERLAVINPYKCSSIDELRKLVLEIIQERLMEVDHIPWAPKKDQFHFLRSVTVVYDTGLILNSPVDLFERLPEVALGSVYYHFVEARRRTENGLDDFSNWLSEFGDGALPLIELLHEIDFYFMSLSELKLKLVDIVNRSEVTNAFK